MVGGGSQGPGVAPVSAIALSASAGDAGGREGGADDDLVGHHVNVAGVAARPELNGQSGVVQSFHTSSGRYHVRLESGEMVALRPACVHKVSAAALAAAMADDTNTPLAKVAVRDVLRRWGARVADARVHSRTPRAERPGHARGVLPPTQGIAPRGVEHAAAAGRDTRPPAAGTWGSRVCARRANWKMVCYC